MNDLAALALSYGGFATFALSQSQHTRKVTQRQTSVPERWLLRCAGLLGVVLALAACVTGWGWGVGLVLWTALLTFAVFGVALTLTYGASRFVPSLIASWCVGVALWIGGVGVVGAG